MPNHVTNRLIFDCSDEKMKEILSAICYDEDSISTDVGLGTIDFNKITPMPQSLNIECGSNTTTSINLYLTFVNPKVSYYGKEKMIAKDFDRIVALLNRKTVFAPYNPNMTPEEIKNKTEFDTEDNLLSLGKTAVNNLLEYGSITWYDWCTRNDTWNTKWNSYNPYEYEGGKEIGFQTAWSAPHPIIEKLSAMYPDVAINHRWANEDLWQGCGSTTYLAGELIDEEVPESEKEQVEMAASIWDYDLEEIGLALNALQTSYIPIDNEDFELIEILGRTTLFSNERLSERDIPSGLFVYHLRDGGNGEQFCTLEKSVRVNHCGSIVTKEQIDFGQNEFIELKGDDSPNFLGDRLSFSQFMEGNFDNKEGFDIVQF